MGITLCENLLIVNRLLITFNRKNDLRHVENKGKSKERRGNSMV